MSIINLVGGGAAAPEVPNTVVSIVSTYKPVMLGGFYVAHSAGIASYNSRYNTWGYILEVYDNSVKIPLQPRNQTYDYATVSDTDKVISTTNLTTTMKLPSIPEGLPLTGTVVFIITLSGSYECIAPTGRPLVTYEGTYSISESNNTVTYTIPIANKSIAELFGGTEVYIYNGNTINAGDNVWFYAIPYLLRK